MRNRGKSLVRRLAWLAVGSALAVGCNESGGDDDVSEASDPGTEGDGGADGDGTTEAEAEAGRDDADGPVEAETGDDGAGDVCGDLVCTGDENATTCPGDCPAECGNGVVEGDEECDDGRNGGAGDGCTDDCTFSCHEATARADCGDMTDDCIEENCVRGGLGWVCEHSNYIGECLYPGCRSGTMDHGTCEDGVCVCHSVPDAGGA
jgi:hypothetical protein